MKILDDDGSYAARVTTEGKIHHRMYECLIPNSMAISEQELDMKGTVQNNRPDIIRAHANELTHTARSIYQLALLHEEGCPITLIKVDRIPEILSLIKAYLKFVAAHFNAYTLVMDGDSVGDGVLDDALALLRRLEDFGNSLTPNAISAKRLLNKDNPLQQLLRSFSPTGGFVGGNTIVDKTMEQVEQQPMLERYLDTKISDRYRRF